MNRTVQNRKPVIGMSVGDFNGIGPEVILKVFADRRMLDHCIPLVFCCKNLVNYFMKLLEITDLPFEVIRNPKQLNTKKLNIFCNWRDDSDLQIEMGKPTKASGEYAFKSLSAAVYAAKQQSIDALVTGPINKKNIQSVDFTSPGHSEYLMKESGASSYLMLMITDLLKVGVITDHIPLKDVSASVTKETILEKLGIFNKTLNEDFSITKPKIAVLGLNPHAGDDGLLGTEEQEFISPAIREVNEKGILAFGPYPADGFFGSQMHLKFDGVLAMYHDQGLTPFKLLGFEKGVNYTAGLPLVRTSPVHGTGYAISGQGIADESSFREAVFTAIKIIRNREMHREISKDPLQTKLVREKEES
ncbi:4-hydroxythreonine-4-phosphate dehydrogenase PdxA [Bacteroidota bacterium]